MTVSCIACSRWSPKQTSPGMARLGFAVCEIKSRHKGHTFSANFEHECEKFNQATDSVVAGRRKFLNEVPE